MRLDTLGPINDFVIHVIAVSFLTSAWIVPVGMFWIYVVHPELTWRVFFLYFILCVFLYFYILNPFLLILSSYFCSEISYFFSFFFHLYFIFFCIALFDFSKKFEDMQRTINFNLVVEEERILNDGLYYYEKILFTFIPLFLIFFCSHSFYFIFFCTPDLVR